MSDVLPWSYCGYLSSTDSTFLFLFLCSTSEGKFTVGALMTDHDEESDCKICSTGQFWKMSTSACASCVAGKTSSVNNKFECEDCGVGKFSSR